MPGDDAHPDEPGEGPSPPVQALVDALLDGDRERADALLQEGIEDTGSFLTVIDALVRPTMAEIGACWQRGDISVAEEHLATATMRTILAQRLPDLPVEADQDRTVLLACVEDNQHEFGLEMLADAYELAGWGSRYMGADVSTEALLAVVERWRPDVLALSLAMEMHVPTARDVVQRVRDLDEPRPTILLGGPLDGDPDTVVQQTDADAWAGGIQHGLEAGDA
jgi:methanogenic corrinoid protein MtbC1